MREESIKPVTVDNIHRPSLFSPGTYLKEWMYRTDNTVNEVSSKADIPVTSLVEVLSGEKIIDTKTASTLEKITGISADFWVIHQTRYLRRKNH